MRSGPDKVCDVYLHTFYGTVGSVEVVWYIRLINLFGTGVP